MMTRRRQRLNRGEAAKAERSYIRTQARLRAWMPGAGILNFQLCTGAALARARASIVRRQVRCGRRRPIWASQCSLLAPGLFRIAMLVFSAVLARSCACV